MNFIVIDVISDVSTTVYIKFTSFCSLMPCSVVASFRLRIFEHDVGEGTSSKKLWLQNSTASRF